MFWIWMILWSIVGVVLGTQINRFVYDWSLFCQHSPSPFSISKRPYHPKPLERVPIVGWFLIKNRNDLFEGPFWIRPILVEIFCGFSLPLLFWFYMTGGPMGGTTFMGSPFGGNNLIKLLPGTETTLWVWFALHVVLFVLMTIATLIDWDERLIPDQITIPGLFISLAVLTIWPNATLPQPIFSMIAVSEIQPFSAFSPSQTPDWIGAWWTLLLVILTWLLWAYLVSYWVFDTRYGLKQGIRYAVASYLRPQRKSGKGQRQMFFLNKLVAALFGLVTLVAIAIFFGAPDRWPIFFSVTVSMMLAGLGAYAIRLLSSWALGMEAFGFGDVTLMFMIGAAFGWQAALLIFVFACIIGLVFAIGTILFTKDIGLAFGPWLCIASVFVVLFWRSVWTGWAERSLFFLGPQFVLGLSAVCLIALPIILLVLQGIKRLLGIHSYQEA